MSENRQIKLAKSILESKGYKVTTGVKLKHTIDTWNMIEKYGIEDYEDHDRYILVSEESYKKMLDGSKNKRYIMDLKLSTPKESKKNPYVHRNEKEHCYDCGHDGWSYDEKDDPEDIDEADVRLSAEDRTNPDKVPDLRSIAKKAEDKEKADAEAQKKAERKAELAEKHKDLIEDIKNSDDPLQTAFDALVPRSGEADTVAGELVRAMMRLLYRDYNDGDVFYEGYGLETCASSAAYLMDKLDSTRSMFEKLAMSRAEDDEYTRGLEKISKVVIDYIIENPELLSEENTEDSRDYDITDIEEYVPEYELTVDIPSNVYDHLEAENIDEIDLEREMHDWDGLSNVEISISDSMVHIEGLDKQWYEELETNLYRWLEQYGDDLDSEYGVPGESSDDEE